MEKILFLNETYTLDSSVKDDYKFQFTGTREGERLGLILPKPPWPPPSYLLSLSEIKMRILTFGLNATIPKIF